MIFKIRNELKIHLKSTDPGNVSKENASTYESTYKNSYSNYAKSIGYDSNDEIHKDKQTLHPTHEGTNFG